MEPIAIAVLSDLHVGSGARARDFCPGGSGPFTDDRFLPTFLRFLTDNDIRADCLLLPGDVSDSGQPAQVKLASQIVEEIARTLGIADNLVFFVPGNHDADWSAFSTYSAADDPFRTYQKYAPLRYPDWLFARLPSASRSGLLAAPHFSLVETDRLLVLHFNSAAHDEPDVSVHHGLVAEEALAAAETSLRPRPVDGTQVRICLVHHHPVLYSDPIPGQPDFSAMDNAEALLALLSRAHFDLLVHGHKHSPRFHTQVRDSGYPLVVLGAGAFSARLDTKWAGHVGNQFHVLRAQGRSADSSIHGTLESWTYLCGTGWQPSAKHTGIVHRSPFGTYAHPTEVKRRLAVHLPGALSQKGWITWTDVTNAIDEYRHLPTDLVSQVLAELGAELGFVVHGDLSDDLVLLME